ncbi:hypothetical protein K505DRAFT_335757 [Melanomma pulvis-pyrius CBS 109.77]|uniref:Uncharacterized protein n=1 Tax=Melanomma pulvis-pyrius CBS 109.77 TaxID=1314802 RepID=A0A6A6XH45_9PLEO|nr:hypothetical protein K505DRAFT_335757 [Melanomma pulvis-pyrius CBS 109.77]
MVFISRPPIHERLERERAKAIADKKELEEKEALREHQRATLCRIWQFTILAIEARKTLLPGEYVDDLFMMECVVFAFDQYLEANIGSFWKQTMGKWGFPWDLHDEIQDGSDKMTWMICFSITAMSLEIDKTKIEQEIFKDLPPDNFDAAWKKAGSQYNALGKEDQKFEPTDPLRLGAA